MNLAAIQLAAIYPEMVIAGAIILMTILSVTIPNSAMVNKLVAAAALIIAAITIFFGQSMIGTSFNGLIYQQPSSNWLRLLLIVCAFFSVVNSSSYLQVRGVLFPEYYILVLGATFGGILALNSNHFITMLVGLETLSLASYMLCAIERGNKLAVEGAFKYFFIGTLTTSFILLGIALLYGSHGQLIYGDKLFPPATLGIIEKKLYFFGGLFFILGIAGKLAAAPVHFWAPDVYQGSPTPVSVYIMVAPKILLVAILYNFLQSPLLFPNSLWKLVVFFMANASLLIGSSMAFLQKDLKRLLAYSSIGHVGYLMLLSTINSPNVEEVIFYYLLTYILANYGIFGIIISLDKGQQYFLIKDLQGLISKSPILTFILGFLLLSLAGIPLTPGFISKLLLFNSLADYVGIVQIIFALSCSVIAAVYYIKVIGHSLQAADVAQQKISLERPAISSSVILAFCLSLLILLWPNFIQLFSH